MRPPCLAPPHCLRGARAPRGRGRSRRDTDGRRGGGSSPTSSWSRMAFSCSSFLAQYRASSSGMSATQPPPSPAPRSQDMEHGDTGTPCWESGKAGVDGWPCTPRPGAASGWGRPWQELSWVLPQGPWGLPEKQTWDSVCLISLCSHLSHLSSVSVICLSCLCPPPASQPLSLQGPAGRPRPEPVGDRRPLWQVTAGCAQLHKLCTAHPTPAPRGSSKRVSSRMRWQVGSLVPQISLSAMMTCESSVSHSPGPSWGRGKGAQGRGGTL
jgi:hypothetical protein